ncbi:ribosome biogenesis GTP-binding protein YihA/YsxC [Clostridium algidicarnis]|uniref:ribosome biogenesis GTP-binding protein YihA/YsxC n=1 Tax=Clostridium algidicarnis TaxID=37659 RepID=UPI001C0D8A48|nr:ribosome biogenesis GTP-binding protein YihA/YsxC [Clostridium algidicarnis]MBU3209180.1 ribosome biogenesis GTP-binding protein YihA/YsxC [Clostridium algidicarnis]
MIIKKSDFVTSAVTKRQYPEDKRTEIAFLGRSNVGKSSLINALTNRKKLAKVSSTPGRTRLINFFLINDDFHLVDLPGYGYAKVSKTEKARWGKIIEEYLISSTTLKRVVLLVDSRHKPSADDVIMYEWINYNNYDVVVIATKSDKISKREKAMNEKIIKDTLKLKPEHRLIFFSAVKKDGREEIVDLLFEDLASK